MHRFATATIAALLVLALVGASVPAAADGGSGGDDPIEIRIVDEHVTISDVEISGDGLPSTSIDRRTYEIDSATLSVDGVTVEVGGSTHEIGAVEVEIERVGVTLENVSIDGSG